MRLSFLIFINTIITFLVFFSFTNYSNTVSFSGDSVEYQSAAVNYVYGNGFMMFGGIEEFEAYQFIIEENDGSNWNKDSFYDLVHFDTINGPVYTFFVGIVYQLFGVKPFYLRLIQLFLICLGASVLIPISNILFKNNGLAIGFLASWLFILSSFTSANEIYAEPLLIFIFALLCYFWIDYKVNRNKLSFYFAVFFLALCVLAKGVFYFAFALIIGMEIIQFFKSKSFVQLKRILLLCFGIPLMLSPYILWQNYQLNKEKIANTRKYIQLNNNNQLEAHLIESGGITIERIETVKRENGIKTTKDLNDFLIRNLIQEEIIGNWVNISSQGDYVLLTSNNEYSIDGDWHPESLENPASFYNTLDSDYSTFQKVFLFYSAYPQNILPSFLNKFKRVFWLSSSSRFMLLLSIILLFTSLIKRVKIKSIVTGALVLSAFLLSFIFKELFYSFIGSHIIILLILSILSCIGLLLQFKKFGLTVLIPFVFSAIIVSLIFYGYFRIIMPYYLIISLLAVYFFIESVYSIAGSKSKSS